MVERSGGRVVLAVELQGPKVRVIMSLALKKKKSKKSVWLDSVARGRGQENGGGRVVEVGSYRYLWALL